MDTEITALDVALIFIDLLSLYFINFMMAKCLLVWTSCSTTLIYVFTRFFSHKHMQVRGLSENLSKHISLRSLFTSSRSQRFCVLMIMMRHYLVEHTKICTYIGSVSKDIWSRGILLFMFTQIPINAYFLVLILLTHQSFADRFLLTFVVIFQLLGCLYVMLPISHMCHKAHQTERYLVPIQASLHGCWLLKDKVKLMNHYEMLRLDRHKISYQIGNISYITNRSLCQASILSPIHSSPIVIAFLIRSASIMSIFS